VKFGEKRGENKMNENLFGKINEKFNKGTKVKIAKTLDILTHTHTHTLSFSK